jgi:hypothetical protein
MNLILIFRPRSRHGITGTAWALSYSVGDVWLLFWTCAAPTIINIIFTYHKKLWLVKALVWGKGLHWVSWLDRSVSRTEIIYLFFLLVYCSGVAVAWGGRRLHRILRVRHIVFVTLLIDDAVEFSGLVQDCLAFRLGTQFDAEEVLTFLQIYVILDLFLQLI